MREEEAAVQCVKIIICRSDSKGQEAGCSFSHSANTLEAGGEMNVNFEMFSSQSSEWVTR